MSRQLLADPDWVNKLKNGQAKQIHRCVRCNKKCLGGLMAHQGTRCVYDDLREKEAKKHKRIPLLNLLASSIAVVAWKNIGKYVFLVIILCSTLLPIYVVGKKYE